MPNYYEFLQVAPQATFQEIQVAVDEKYNQSRRLVTHHDPNIVNQANMALQSLEKIRETLLNPDRRSIYDEALGFSSNVMGGLVDPQLAASAPHMGMPVAAPPMMGPQRPAPLGPAVAPAEGWHCTRCNSISQVGSQFCKSCGNEIGQSCPKCHTVFEKTAKFCPTCGVNPQAYLEEQERARVEAYERQRAGIRQKLSEAEAHLQTGLYGKAKDALGAFEGLGKPSASNPVICGRTEPEWKKAEALNQSANSMRSAFIKQNILKITIGYAAAGVALGLVMGVINLISHISNVVQYDYAFNWTILFSPLLNALGLAIGGAIAGVIGSGIYFYQWGGRQGAQKDLIYGAIAPIILAILLPFSFYCFGAILMLVLLWFGISVFGSSRR